MEKIFEPRPSATGNSNEILTASDDVTQLSDNDVKMDTPDSEQASTSAISFRPLQPHEVVRPKEKQQSAPPNKMEGNLKPRLSKQSNTCDDVIDAKERVDRHEMMIGEKQVRWTGSQCGGATANSSGSGGGGVRNRSKLVIEPRRNQYEPHWLLQQSSGESGLTRFDELTALLHQEKFQVGDNADDSDGNHVTREASTDCKMALPAQHSQQQRGLSLDSDTYHSDVIKPKAVTQRKPMLAQVAAKFYSLDAGMTARKATPTVKSPQTDTIQEVDSVLDAGARSTFGELIPRRALCDSNPLLEIEKFLNENEPKKKESSAAQLARKKRSQSIKIKSKSKSTSSAPATKSQRRYSEHMEKYSSNKKQESVTEVDKKRKSFFMFRMGGASLEPRQNQYEKHALLESRDEHGFSPIDYLLSEMREGSSTEATKFNFASTSKANSNVIDVIADVTERAGEEACASGGAPTNKTCSTDSEAAIMTQSTSDVTTKTQDLVSDSQNINAASVSDGSRPSAASDTEMPLHGSKEEAPLTRRINANFAATSAIGNCKPLLGEDRRAMPARSEEEHLHSNGDNVNSNERATLEVCASQQGAGASDNRPSEERRNGLNRRKTDSRRRVHFEQQQHEHDMPTSDMKRNEAAMTSAARCNESNVTQKRGKARSSSSLVLCCSRTRSENVESQADRQDLNLQEKLESVHSERQRCVVS